MGTLVPIFLFLNFSYCHSEQSEESHLTVKGEILHSVQDDKPDKPCCHSERSEESGFEESQNQARDPSAKRPASG